MADSWTTMRQVPQEQLQHRIELIKELSADPNEAELYEIVKDTETGEHYLHYGYMHVHIADGMKESFHQLLPLDSDEVLGLLFGEDPYTYPEHWRKPFLRNGPNGHYVWFDPADVLAGAEEDRVKEAAELERTLKEWKQEGKVDRQSVQELLNRIDKVFGPDTEQN